MTLRTGLGLTVIFSLGLAIGSGPSPLGWSAFAQDPGEAPLSEDAANEVRTANRSLDAARDELEAEGRYTAATVGTNPFLVLTGGGDAVADLESDNGVDPETFAALYAGRASEAIQADVTIDDEGRVLYKGRVVRMYSIKRLKEMYDRREQLASGE